MERIVTPKSSSTKAQRAAASRQYMNEINETHRGNREKFINQYNQNYFRNNPPKVINTPPPSPMRPDIRDLRPPPNPTQQIIQGQLTRPGVTGSQIPWTMKENLAFQLSKLRRSKIGGLHPWIRALQWALDAYDLFNFMRELNKGPGGYSAPGWSDFQQCNGGPGALQNIQSWPAGTNSCPVPYYSPIGPSAGVNDPFAYYHNVDWSDTNIWGDPRFYPLKIIRRNPGTTGKPAMQFRPYLPAVVAQMPQFKTPTIPVIHRPVVQDALAKLGPQPMTDPGKGRRPPLRPRPYLPHRNQPPGPSNKEKKVRVPAALMGAFKVATEYTEAADLVESLWDALPSEYQKGVKRSGVTNRQARVGPGVRYSTPLDRAQHLFKNWQHIDVADAVKNIIANHMEDAIIGRLQKGAAGSMKVAGGTGWGQLI